jgi:hypothetical protein
VAPGTTAAAPSAPEWPADGAADSRSAAASAVSAARAPRFAPLRPDLGDTAAFSAIDAEPDTAAPAAPAEPASTPGTPGTPDLDTAPAPAREADAAPVFGAAAPAFGVGSTPAYDKDGTSALDSSPPPSEPAVGPLPVYGAPTRGERQASGGSDGSELPIRTRQGQLQREIIVPPAAGAGEEHRLPIFESVESDWFRRGRSGAGRAGQVNSVASSSGTGGWSSPADEGWRAAEAAHVPTSGGVTLSGLPKRVPRANLVPGTVGVEAAASAAPASARSATQARDRLASFQRGMREGRAAARDSDVPNGEDNSAI